MAMATNTTAPSRAHILPSIRSPSIAAVEHLRVAGLVAAARRQKAAALLAPLCGGRGPLGLRQRAGAAIGRDQGDQVGELLRLEGEKLVTGLGRLQRAGCRLALVDERRHLRAVRVDIADDA